MPKEKDLFVPDPEDLRIWEEYINAPPRPKPVIPRDKYRRKRKKRQSKSERRAQHNRPSPVIRGFRSIMVRRSTYEMLFEMKVFYNKSFCYLMHELVNIAYKKTYKQAELLARIEANRIKDEQTPNPAQSRRRYNV